MMKRAIFFLVFVLVFLVFGCEPENQSIVLNGSDATVNEETGDSGVSTNALWKQLILPELDEGEKIVDISGYVNKNNKKVLVVLTNGGRWFEVSDFQSGTIEPIPNSSGVIFSGIAKNSEGYIWAVGDGGNIFFKSKNGVWVKKNKKDQEFQGKWMDVLINDMSKNVYICGEDGWLARFSMEGKDESIFQMKDTGHILKLFTLAQYTFGAATNALVFIDNNDVAKSTKFEVTSGPDDLYIYSGFAVDLSHIYLVGNKGIYKYIYKDSDFQNLPELSGISGSIYDIGGGASLKSIIAVGDLTTVWKYDSENFEWYNWDTDGLPDKTKLAKVFVFPGGLTFVFDEYHNEIYYTNQ